MSTHSRHSPAPPCRPRTLFQPLNDTAETGAAKPRPPPAPCPDLPGSLRPLQRPSRCPGVEPAPDRPTARPALRPSRRDAPPAIACPNRRLADIGTPTAARRRRGRARRPRGDGRAPGAGGISLSDRRPQQAHAKADGSVGRPGDEPRRVGTPRRRRVRIRVRDAPRQGGRAETGGSAELPSPGWLRSNGSGETGVIQFARQGLGVRVSPSPPPSARWLRQVSAPQPPRSGAGLRASASPHANRSPRSAERGPATRLVLPAPPR